MPYLQIYVPDTLTEAVRGELAADATRLLADLLGKRAEVTVVRIVATPAEQWFVAGGPLPQLGRAAFAEVKITRGSNSEPDKARFLAELHRLLAERLAPMSAPTYAVIHEVPGGDWGYDGLTQAGRGARP